MRVFAYDLFSLKLMIRDMVAYKYLLGLYDWQLPTANKFRHGLKIAYPDDFGRFLFAIASLNHIR